MSSPHPALRTMDLPEPTVWDSRPLPAIQEALESRFKPLQSTHPGMVRFARSNKNSPNLRFDHRWHLESFEGGAAGVPQKSGPFRGTVRAYKGPTPEQETKEVAGFCKITHLLDAFRMIQGQYPMSQHPGLPAPGRKSAKVFSKLHDAHNQAYVDAVACYMLSKLREAEYSPHFSLFYGAYLAIAKEYYFNITEDFLDIRFDSWFWRNQKEGVFRLLGFDKDQPLEEDNPLLEAPEDLDSSDEDDSDETEGSEIEELDDGNGSGAEVESLHSASITTATDTEEESPTSNSGDSAASEAEDEDSWSDVVGQDIKIFALISQFPTMLMFLESNEGTLDSLLGDRDENGELPEAKWSAWLFQVIAALCQIQSLWAMTHNDLHSNNILWTATDKEYLHYKTNDGRLWRVPTYGKLFRIIDFGRAIYTHNNTLCISDDYFGDNEAGGQYNFGPFYNPEDDRAYPNPSFDLCRLAVSVVDALYPQRPADVESGAILSDEPGLRQMETKSALFNVLWSWLIDDDGRNVLVEPDGTERYPGFDLYRVIARKVKGAVPREQLERAPFRDFALPKDSAAPAGERVYPLFC